MREYSTEIADIAVMAAAACKQPATITLETVTDSNGAVVRLRDGSPRYRLIVNAGDIAEVWAGVHCRPGAARLEVPNAMRLLAISRAVHRRLSQLKARETTDNVVRCWEVRV